MSKKKKSDRKESKTNKILLAVAIIELIKAVLELIDFLNEGRGGNSPANKIPFSVLVVNI